MKKILLISILLGMFFMLTALNPPRNLIGTPGNQSAVLTWDEPLPPNQEEIRYHDTEPDDSFYQHFNLGYGTVFDLSGYDNATLIKIDFYHSSYGINGPHQYNIHLVNWQTHETIAVINNQQTTVNDNWELNVSLNETTAVGQVGVFIEPLSNTTDDAYPVIPFDASPSGHISEVINLDTNQVTASANHGDFLIDLWITADNVVLNVPQLVRTQPVSNEITSFRRNQSIISPQDVYNNSTREFLGYNVYREGEQVNTALVLNETYTDTGLTNGTSYNYYVTAIYNEGESDPSNTVEVTPVFIGSLIFSEGFESSNLNNWYLIDNDGDSHNWEIGGTASGITPHSGNYCAASASYDNNIGVLTPDNYLISPFINVDGTFQLKFWVKPQSNSYPSEHYELRLSTSASTSPQVEDFTELLFDETLTAGDWREVSLEVDGHNGNIRLAWIHNECTDMFMIKIDDIEVRSLNDIQNDEIIAGKTASLHNYPNPFNPNTTIRYTVTDKHVQNISLAIYNVKGQQVKSFRNLEQQNGQGEVVWNGKDENNKDVSSGIYYYRLEGDTQSELKKMILMK